MKYLGFSDQDVSDTEMQLSKINLIDCAEKKATELFCNDERHFKDPSVNNSLNARFECAESVLILKETELFLNEVRQFKDPSENNPFNALSECAKTALIFHIPMRYCNTIQTMSYVISKLRNKMKLPLLNAILTIKLGLIRV